MAGSLSWLAERLRANGKVLALQDEIIGANQTWQDKTATRSFNTEYTNNTGVPIMISVIVYNYNGTTFNPSLSASLLVGGLKIQSIILRDIEANGASNDLSLSAIIPVGAKYNIDIDTEEGFLRSWSELRGEA